MCKFKFWKEIGLEYGSEVDTRKHANTHLQLSEKMLFASPGETFSYL